MLNFPSFSFIVIGKIFTQRLYIYSSLFYSCYLFFRLEDTVYFNRIFHFLKLIDLIPKW